ncbi:MAG: helix-hairpin-helix domain-containing protein [Promethearchaeota archaeon]
MKIDRNWATAAILTLPFTWVIAFLLFKRPVLQTNPSPLFPAILGLFLGLIIGGFIADKLPGRTLLLIVFQAMILVIGIAQWILPPDVWSTLFGQLLLTLLLFLFGCALVMFTIFLNRLVSSVNRERVVAITTAIGLFISAILLFFWTIFGTTNFVPAVTAGLILFGLLIAFFVQPWKGELQTYMVPGFIRPYAVWWVIYLAAFGLYVWATPPNYRHVFNGLFLIASGLLPAELILIGLSGAVFVFALVPFKFGRKIVFNIGTLLLGLLCIFGGAHFDPIIRDSVSIILSLLTIFVAALIIGVGAWLVWAEIGSVRMKGRHAAFGWLMVGCLVAVIWWITMSSSVTHFSLLVYPIAASLVLISIFPLTNAREVIWNERLVEDIDVSVDSRQVSRALRDLEVDTSLRSIEQQIETEINHLMNTTGVTSKQAKTLRDEGYETPQLVARADPESLAQALSISPERAEQIINNAKSRTRQSTRSTSKSSKKRTTK